MADGDPGQKSGKSLGVISGYGQFPGQVIRGARARGYTVCAVGFSGNTERTTYEEADAHLQVHIGQFGKLIDFFHSRGVRELVFAGGIHKPSALALRPDMRTIKMAMGLKHLNDTALLGAVADELRREGFSILSPLDFVPELTVSRGVLSRREPTRLEREDIAYGWGAAKALGELDIGQCIVVHKKAVVAVEAMEGTDETLARAGRLIERGGTAVKVFKPGQHAFIDQPSIGLRTIESMTQAGLSCLVVEAGKSLFFDQQKSITLADQRGLCLIGAVDGAW